MKKGDCSMYDVLGTDVIRAQWAQYVAIQCMIQKTGKPVHKLISRLDFHFRSDILLMVTYTLCGRTIMIRRIARGLNDLITNIVIIERNT